MVLRTGSVFDEPGDVTGKLPQTLAPAVGVTPRGSEFKRMIGTIIPLPGETIITVATAVLGYQNHDRVTSGDVSHTLANFSDVPGDFVAADGR